MIDPDLDDLPDVTGTTGFPTDTDVLPPPPPPPDPDTGTSGSSSSGSSSDDGTSTSTTTTGLDSSSTDESSSSTTDEPPRGCAPEEPLDLRRSLIETNPVALETMDMPRALARIAENGGMVASASLTHDLLIDHSNDLASAHFPAAPGHCDAEFTDGQPSLNGFPIQCPRVEGLQIGNIEQWVPIAAVNRLDLAPADGSNCGEQRLIYANNALGRMFIIFEAQIPNPEPACGIAACRPIADFWADQSEIEDPIERGARLSDAFLDIEPSLLAFGFDPFLTAQHMTFGTGQVRTNNFDQSPWSLKEFKLTDDGGTLTPTQVPVTSNVFGPLLNDNIAHPLGDTCRQAFLDAMEGLVTNDVNLMGLDMPPECLAGESLEDFDSLYDVHISEASQQFRDAIEARAAELGTNLTAQEVGARAGFAASCIGCHELHTGIDLGDGVTAPISTFFVHVNEFETESCGEAGGQCFTISQALADEFLPFRRDVMLEQLAECPDVCGSEVAPGPKITALPSLDLGRIALMQLERQARGPRGRLTIGGRPLNTAH